MNVISLVVDRLALGYLGCYGNAWVTTPEFCALATESFVFDAALCESPQLDDLYRAWWTGRSAWQPPLANEPVIIPRGITTTLLSDVALDEVPWLNNSVSERIEVPCSASRPQAADIEETHLASYFAAAIEALEAQRSPFLLWLHTGSLGLTWDAPQAMRMRYADPEEPPPPEGADIPQRVLPRDYDPDVLLAAAQSYAAQVALLDSCLGLFIDALRQSPHADNTALLVIGARGMALGEHRRIGGWDRALCGETVQAPLLIRMPDKLGAMARSAALVQGTDLAATLAELLGSPIAGESGTAQSLLPLVRDERVRWRDRVALRSSIGERGLRTARWYLRESGSTPVEGDVANSIQLDDPATPRHWLYAKPDDRWEANDVADRCPEVVAAMLEAQGAWCQAVETNTLDQLAPLPTLLTARQS